ncbi:unnamed protein product [Cylindrotheca closterium]|uniref:Uncharacterized protein n=1 Tax=Cylindrotheca closterium TaxID=2856 RepID=A0AAD2JNF5_9STRA|nr:unnamed protein product [Cylindrotheca closterium]
MLPPLNRHRRSSIILRLHAAMPASALLLDCPFVPSLHASADTDILKLSCLCWMLILIEHILHVNGYIFKGLVIAAEFLHISVLRGILMDTDTIRFAEQPINGHQDLYLDSKHLASRHSAGGYPLS